MAATTKKANTRTNMSADKSVAEVPMTEPLDIPVKGGLDGLDDNVDLGSKSKEVVYPEGAFVAGIPDWLPLYRDETVTETATKGDVTWYHTDKDRWLTTKGVVPQATVVFHGPTEPFPEPEDWREHSRKLGEDRAEQIEKEARILAGDPSNYENVREALGTSAHSGHGLGSKEATESKNTNLELEEADASDVYSGMNHEVLVALATKAGIIKEEADDDEKLREALRAKGGNAAVKGSDQTATTEAAKATGGAKGGDE